MFGVPNNGVGVEVLGGVKPKMELLLFVTLALSKHIGMKSVRIPTEIAKKLKIYLIMCRPL